jgi:hypothetical protein
MQIAAELSVIFAAISSSTPPYRTGSATSDDIPVVLPVNQKLEKLCPVFPINKRNTTAVPNHQPKLAASLVTALVTYWQGDRGG